MLIVILAEFEEHRTVFFVIVVHTTVYYRENILKWERDADGIEVVFSLFLITELFYVMLLSSFLTLHLTPLLRKAGFPFSYFLFS